MRVAVVGHVEWVQFARVERVPRAGEIVHAHETWDEAAGGGAVAAVQLARLAGGGADFFTALRAAALDAVFFLACFFAFFAGRAGFFRAMTNPFRLP